MRGQTAERQLKTSVHVHRTVLLTSTSLSLHKSGSTGLFHTSSCRKHFDFLKVEKQDILAHDLLTSAISFIICETGCQRSAPVSIDVKGLGRPKEFSGKKEHFQQWSKKTEAFFAGVIKESEMMLEWAAEQATEMTTAIDLRVLADGYECRPRRQNLEFVLTLSPTRGRTRWRHGGDCRSDMIRRQEEGNETFCARSFLLDVALFWNSKR